MSILPNDPPRAAYFHVPFCRHRCGYCNFTLIAGRDDLVASYLQAIELEIAALPDRYELDSLFFGGGTPTHLPPDALRRLFELARERFDLVANAEFSVEANPLDLDDARCEVLREFGVTRLSLGVQSFHDSKLTFLERDHRAAQIAAAYEQARRTAREVSLDLIFGVPGETVDHWNDDLRAALALAPDHISTYGLTFDPGSAFYGKLQRGLIERAPETIEAQMYELAIDTFTAAGYEHYEVSNFARPGRRSRHNETYWRGRSYFAFGPGAARYVQGTRSMNHRSTTTYIQRMLTRQPPIAESETLSPHDRAIERLVFGLRRLEGLSRAEFLGEMGASLDELAPKELPSLIAGGFLESCGDRLRLTRRGLLVSDAIFTKLLSN